MNESNIEPLSISAQSDQFKSRNQKSKSRTVSFQLLSDCINVDSNNSTKANLNFIIEKNNFIQTTADFNFAPCIQVLEENQVSSVEINKNISSDESIRLNFCDLNGDLVNATNNKLNVAKEPVQFVTIPFNNQSQIHTNITNTSEWSNNANKQTIIILQPGDNLQSINQVLKNDIKVTTDINLAVPKNVKIAHFPLTDKPVDILQSANQVFKKDMKATPDLSPVITRKKIAPSHSGIIYRVVNPEDLNLYDPKKVNKNGIKRPNILSKMSMHKKSKTISVPNQRDPSIQPKKLVQSGESTKPELPYRPVRLVPLSKLIETDQLESSTVQTPSVTRCGRTIRPPRRTTAIYEQIVDEIDMKLNTLRGDKSHDDIVKTHHVCPTCKKSYSHPKRLGVHLNANPNHATTPKSADILAEYAEVSNKKKLTTANAECQTENCETSHSIDNLKENNKCVDNNISSNKSDERSLFRILMRILQKTAPEHRANIFIRQLAILTSKLRKLMPCLLQKSENNSLCSINDPVSKILGVSPGNYHLNMDAFVNVKTQSSSNKHSKHSLSENTSYNTNNPYDDLWTTEKDKECASKIDDRVNNCTEINHVNKWSSPAQKPKWIPIGSDNTVRESLNVTNENWIPTNCDVLLNNTDFNPSSETMKTWEANLQLKDTTSTENSWITNSIGELNIPQDLTSPTHILSNNSILTQSVNSPSNANSLEFNCKDKMVNIHSDLVFGVEKDILPMNNITTDTAVCVSNSNGSDNFDFTDSHFDIQMDSNKLNFSDSQFNDLKYDSDTLPPFRKIEPKTLQLPGSLNDITSDTDKFHISSDDSILNASNYPVTSESLELSMDTTQINTLDNIVNSCDITKAITSNEDSIHCDGETLLNNTELNLPISVSNTLSANESILSVSESSLDNRLNLSTNQSVLNLLDPLTSDCLSFSDSDLNPRTTFEFEFLKFGEHD